jgi:uncharacterized protein (DUF1800 family)
MMPFIIRYFIINEGNYMKTLKIINNYFFTDLISVIFGTNISLNTSVVTSSLKLNQMERRNFLKKIIRVEEEKTGASLNAYSGKWGKGEALHLLRRTTIGPNIESMNTVVSKGLRRSLDLLLEDQPEIAPPVNYIFENDPFVPIGSSWVDAPYNDTQDSINYRQSSLRAWNTEILLKETISIREKITLFWHNHFPIDLGTVPDPKYMYDYIRLLRSNGLKNFKNLVFLVTLNPAMLRYLNGNQNAKGAPNENFARELLELFTIGKGPIAGPGDYTNYTELDIKEMAKCLTGWTDSGFYSKTATTIKSSFTASRHDTTTKQLSNRFDSVKIVNENENEYKTVINIIFSKPEVAKYICRKLYKYFVYYKISEEVEKNIIEPLANLFIAEKFEIKPVLRTLLQSEHFFDISTRGNMIKNPIDFSFGLLKQTGLVLSTDNNKRSLSLQSITRLIGGQQMEYFYPPDVSGWKAYYQEPSYYRIWINATTLNARMGYTNTLAGNGVTYNNIKYQIDVLKFIGSMKKVKDPNLLIKELGEFFFPFGLTDSQIVDLKTLILPGAPDYEWEEQYEAYLNNPTNATIKNALETKVRNLVKAMLTMPENYLS